MSGNSTMPAPVPASGGNRQIDRWYALMARLHAANAAVAQCCQSGGPSRHVDDACEQQWVVRFQMTQTPAPRPDLIRDKLAALRDLLSEGPPNNHLDLLFFASIDGDLRALHSRWRP